MEIEYHDNRYYVSGHLWRATKIRNFDGSDSDWIMYRISVKQLWMNSNILIWKLYLAPLIFILLRHY